MKSEIFHRLRSVPPLVYIVITQATRRRVEGAITDAVFDEQIRRIEHEELTPNGMKLLVGELPGGRVRFIIKQAATGAVCDMLHFDADGALESDSAELSAAEVFSK